MNFQCPFCFRTFSQRSAYSQHTQICLRKAEVDEEESNSETHSIDLTQDVNESDDNELMEYKPFQEAAQDTSFSSMESTYGNLLSEISIMSYEENIELEESEVLEESEESEESEIFEEAKEPEPEALTEFPNDAYKDLMVLHKILLHLLKTMSMKEKVFIKNKITEYGGRIPKGLCQQAPNYYHLFYIRMQQLQIHWVKANYIRYIYQLVIFQRGVATNQ